MKKLTGLVDSVPGFLEGLINLAWAGLAMNLMDGWAKRKTCGSHVKLEHIHEDKYRLLSLLL